VLFAIASSPIKKSRSSIPRLVAMLEEAERAPGLEGIKGQTKRIVPHFAISSSIVDGVYPSTNGDYLDFVTSFGILGLSDVGLEWSIVP